jgi:hypothetical protein
VIGPVGLAETISIWMCSFVAAEPAPYSAPAASISVSASRYQAGASQRLTKPGPAISARSTCGKEPACSTSCSAIARGACLRAPASRIATLVA